MQERVSSPSPDGIEPAGAQPATSREGGLRTCFVIGPDAEEGAASAKHLDDVLHCLIEPACKRSGYALRTGDPGSRPGRITGEIIRSLLDHDIIVCVLTGGHPSVYFELAIAGSAGRPIIVLKQKHERLPFAVEDVRVVEYDLEPRRVWEQVHVEQICQAISGLEHDGLNRAVVPFAPRLSPLGAGSLDLRIARQYGDLPSHEALRIATRAGHRLDLCGLTLWGWTNDEPLCRIVSERGDNNLAVRLLLMAPDNPALAQMNDTEAEGGLDQLRGMIRDSFSAWNAVAKRHRSVEVRSVAKGILYQQAMITDSELLWVPYLNRYSTRESPAVQVLPPATASADPIIGEHARRGDQRHLLDAIGAEFDYLWRRNASAESG